jgi:hypothetical protein
VVLKLTGITPVGMIIYGDSINYINSVSFAQPPAPAVSASAATAVVAAAAAGNTCKSGFHSSFERNTFSLRLIGN